MEHTVVLASQDSLEMGPFVTTSMNAKVKRYVIAKLFVVIQKGHTSASARKVSSVMAHNVEM